MNKQMRLCGCALLLAGVVAHGQLVKSGERIAFLGDSITQQGAGGPGGYVRLVISGLEANGVKAEAIPAGISGHKSNQIRNCFGAPTGDSPLFDSTMTLTKHARIFAQRPAKASFSWSEIARGSEGATVVRHGRTRRVRGVGQLKRKRDRGHTDRSPGRPAQPQ